MHEITLNDKNKEIFLQWVNRVKSLGKGYTANYDEDVNKFFFCWRGESSHSNLTVWLMIESFGSEDDWVATITCQYQGKARRNDSFRHVGGQGKHQSIHMGDSILPYLSKNMEYFSRRHYDTFNEHYSKIVDTFEHWAPDIENIEVDYAYDESIVPTICAYDEAALVGEIRQRKTDAFKAYEKATKLKSEKARKALEPLIADDAKASYFYASCLLFHRFPEGEPIILTSPHYSVAYANHVLNARWPEAEPKILDDVHQGIMYCEYVIKGRWPELEERILSEKANNQPYNCMSYATNIMKQRWPAAEPIIAAQGGYIAKRYAMDVFHIDEKEAEEGVLDDRFESMGFNIFEPVAIEDIGQIYNYDEAFKAYDKIGQLLESI